MGGKSIRDRWYGLRGHGRIRRLAWNHLHRNELEQAIQFIRLGKSRFPHSMSFEILNARYSLSQGNRESLEQSLARIETLSPTDEYDVYEFAVIKHLLGRYAESIELLEHVTKQNGNRGLQLAAYHRIPTILLQMGHADEAMLEAANCVAAGGYQLPIMIGELCQLCSPDVIEQALLNLLRIRARKLKHKIQRLTFLSYLAAATGKWDLAIESTGLATELEFKSQCGADQWEDSQPPLRPSFLVIGAMKAGSTTLFHQLCSHPQFVSPLRKEIHFFGNQDWPDEYYFHHFPRIARPRSLFVTGEVSPSYYALDIVERVQQMLPDIKLVFIRRDPVDRAISHFFHNKTELFRDDPIDVLVRGMDTILNLNPLDLETLKQMLRDRKTADTAINSYLLLSCYDLLLRPWKAAFPTEQILEIELDQLASSPQTTYERLFQFLEMSSHPIDESLIVNAGSYQSDSQDLIKTKRKLADFFAKLNSH